MRDFLDAILAFIGAESLTDEEFESLEIEDPEYSEEVYLALKGILEARESISETLDRLKYYFLAAGAEVEGLPARTPMSQVYVGDEL